MCGVPVERADDYLQRLIGLGHRVAVCEQIEDPAEAKKRGAKSVVRRDVVRLVTPGTITEDTLLEPGRANLLVAVARARRVRRRLALWARRGRHLDRALRAVSETDGRRARGRDRPPRAARDPACRTRSWTIRTLEALLARDARPRSRRCRATGSIRRSAERRLKRLLRRRDARRLRRFARAEIAAAGGRARSMSRRTQIGSAPAADAAGAASARGAALAIDAATRANLELTRTLVRRARRQPARDDRPHRDAAAARGCSPSGSPAR